MLRIGGDIKAWQFAAVAAVTFAILALLWVLATSNEWVEAIFLPSPSSVWERMVDLAQGGELWEDTRISVFRILVGFLLAT
ncbi:MAG: ABC transporter permease, partial [Gammaproteobacteria bacterium]